MAWLIVGIAVAAVVILTLLVFAAFCLEGRMDDYDERERGIRRS
jgi:hypothetical protein